MWTRARFNLEAVHRDVKKRKTKEKKDGCAFKTHRWGLSFR